MIGSAGPGVGVTWTSTVSIFVIGVGAAAGGVAAGVQAAKIMLSVSITLNTKKILIRVFMVFSSRNYLERQEIICAS